MSVRIISTGLYTTIQDAGRAGYAHQGIPPGGALDLPSYHLSNTLINNDISQCALEITLSGPKIEFLDDHIIGLSGADLSPKINGEAITMNQSHSIPRGSVLSFGRPLSGCRAYLSISGEWDIPYWLGSVSPMTYGECPVNKTSILTKDQIIPIVSTNLRSASVALSGRKFSNELEVMLGPETEEFSSQALSTLFSESYMVTDSANRMGYRLSGPTITVPDYQLISSPVIPGTMQVNSQGQIIITHRDGQTTGGYHRIGVLTEQSLNDLAQLKPRDTLTFKSLMT